jgi:serine/threonine protein kinase
VLLTLGGISRSGVASYTAPPCRWETTGRRPTQQHAPGELAAGTVLGGYRIEAMAGRGGMGIVYRARQLSLGRTVALKVIDPLVRGDSGFRERFERESVLAPSLDHPNVVTIYEAGEDHGRLFASMRFVPGTDLGALLAAEGRLDPEPAAGLIAGYIDSWRRSG